MLRVLSKSQIAEDKATNQLLLQIIIISRMKKLRGYISSKGGTNQPHLQGVVTKEQSNYE
jgi:hypothetical protein